MELSRKTKDVFFWIFNICLITVCVFVIVHQNNKKKKYDWVEFKSDRITEIAYNSKYSPKCDLMIRQNSKNEGFINVHLIYGEYIDTGEAVALFKKIKEYFENSIYCDYVICEEVTHNGINYGEAEILKPDYKP